MPGKGGRADLPLASASERVMLEHTMPLATRVELSTLYCKAYLRNELAGGDDSA